MSTQTSIQWTDVTDNIIVAAQGGWWCRMISPGCANCYAAKLNQSTYFKGNHLPYSGEPPKLKLRTDLIDGWVRQRNPKRHFVASMTDIFGDWVPREWVFRFLDGMSAAPAQTFQLLTKRAENMAFMVNAWLLERRLEVAPANMWFGVSVEDQKRADERIPWLSKIPAKVRFLSAEPLLGPIQFRTPADLLAIDWVIVGGESGPNARHCNIEWVRSIVKQCASASNRACFVKQLGSLAAEPTKSQSYPSENTVALVDLKHPKGGDPAEWPNDLRVRQFP